VADLLLDLGAGCSEHPEAESLLLDDLRPYPGR
jgi:hypothetical protein